MVVRLYLVSLWMPSGWWQRNNHDILMDGILIPVNLLECCWGSWPPKQFSFEGHSARRTTSMRKYLFFNEKRLISIVKIIFLCMYTVNVEPVDWAFSLLWLLLPKDMLKIMFMTIYDKTLYDKWQNCENVGWGWDVGGDKHWGVMTPEWGCDTPMGGELTGMHSIYQSPRLHSYWHQIQSDNRSMVIKWCHSKQVQLNWHAWRLSPCIFRLQYRRMRNRTEQ